MKKLILILLLAGVCSAQQIDPSQIKPGTWGPQKINGTTPVTLFATGDGSTGNRWAGWEDAVNAMPASSDIFLPCGEYTQTKPIVAQSGWAFHSASACAVIYSAHTGNGFTAGVSPGDGANINNVRLVGVAFINTNASNTGACTFIGTGHGVVTDQVYCQGFKYSRVLDGIEDFHSRAHYGLSPLKAGTWIVNGPSSWNSKCNIVSGTSTSGTLVLTCAASALLSVNDTVYIGGSSKADLNSGFFQFQPWQVSAVSGTTLTLQILFGSVADGSTTGGYVSRTAVGFSNAITFDADQMNGPVSGNDNLALVDDGGAAHVFNGGNLSNGDEGGRFAGVNGLTLNGLYTEAGRLVGTTFREKTWEGNYVGPVEGINITGGAQAANGSAVIAVYSAIGGQIRYLPVSQGDSTYFLTPSVVLGADAISRVSVTNGSTAMTLIAGDKFSTAWATKSIFLEGVAYTITSCASTTACTLSGNYAASTSATVRMLSYVSTAPVSGVDVTGLWQGVGRYRSYNPLVGGHSTVLARNSVHYDTVLPINTAVLTPGSTLFSSFSPEIARLAVGKTYYAVNVDGSNGEWIAITAAGSGNATATFASTKKGSSWYLFGADDGRKVPYTVLADTATALAANGTNCAAGLYPLGVDASGNAESCTAVVLSGVSGSIGGGALGAGACASATVSITGVTAGMVGTAKATDGTDQDNYEVRAFGSASGVATVKVCAIGAGTPTAKTYNVRMIP